MKNKRKKAARAGIPAPKTVLEFLSSKQITVSAVCGGKGTCGLCRVRIKGKKMPVYPPEKKLISAALLKEGYRLACQQRWVRGIRFSIPKNARHQIKKNPSRIGLAIDIGTTVIKAATVDLVKKEVIAQNAVFNPQTNLGGDILSRVTAALSGKHEELKIMLERGIEEVSTKLGIDKPEQTSVVGNPVMLSFFLGRPLRGYSRHPYDGGLKHRSIARIGSKRVFPIVGGFVGGDTLAGIYALGPPPSRSFRRLYIDLGTNGEVAVIERDRIWATSTAAGPAFEGAGISCGSLAVPGAVDEVWYDDGFKYHTIRGRSPVGICASGLVDLLACALEAGHLDESGRIIRPIRIADFSLKQEDIRTLQLAIAALHAGIIILLEKTGFYSSQIDEAVITGEFGRHLNESSLIRIGLIPTGIKSITRIADLPLKGAVQALVDRNCSRRVARLKRSSCHVDLARVRDFQQKYVSGLRLSPWN